MAYDTVLPWEAIVRYMGKRMTDAELEKIMADWARKYEERLFAGPSATAEKPKEEPERKAWAWSYAGNVWEVKGEEPVEEPKRKLSFREWLDGGMKGEC